MIPLLAALSALVVGAAPTPQDAGSDAQGPISGVLIDDRTAEPIPDFAIDLRFSSSETERVVTDAQGRFESGPYPRRRLSLILIDDDRSPRPMRRGSVRTTHDPATKEAESEGRELRIEIGPTYRFQLFDPSGLQIRPAEVVAGFHAELFHDPPRTEGVVTRDERGGLFAVDAPRAPLRVSNGDDSTLWTRFRDRKAERLFGGGPWWLEIRDEEGLLAGGARVESVVGITGAPLRIQLGQRAVLEFESAMPGDSFLQLEKLAVQPLRGTRLRWLQPVPGHLDSIARQITGRHVELVPEVNLLRFNPGEPVLPREASVTCFPNETTRLALLEDLEDLELRLAAVQYPYAAPRIAPVSELVHFGPLPEIEFSLSCHGVFPWDGLILQSSIVPAQPPKEFEFRIDARMADFVLLAVNAEDDSPIADPEFRWQHGTFVDWTSAVEGNRILARDVPVGAWALRGATATLRASGYVDQKVDLAALVATSPREAFRVEMERGWSTVLVAYDRRSREPLKGVSAALDGVLQSTSGADGRIHLRADTLPERLDIELEGYRWVDGDIEWLRHELLAQDAFEPRVWLAPDDY